MRKAGNTLPLIIVALSGLLYFGVFNRAVPVTTAEARGTDNNDVRSGARWEYCAVSRAAYVATNRGGAYWISYFKESGVEVVGIEENVLDHGVAVARTIARLGDEGWEMVGQSELPVRTGRVEALYFKRLKQ